MNRYKFHTEYRYSQVRYHIITIRYWLSIGTETADPNVNQLNPHLCLIAYYSSDQLPDISPKLKIDGERRIFFLYTKQIREKEMNFFTSCRPNKFWEKAMNLFWFIYIVLTSKILIFQVIQVISTMKDSYFTN